MGHCGRGAGARFAPNLEFMCIPSVVQSRWVTSGQKAHRSKCDTCSHNKMRGRASIVTLVANLTASAIVLVGAKLAPSNAATAGLFILTAVFLRLTARQSGWNLRAASLLGLGLTLLLSIGKGEILKLAFTPAYWSSVTASVLVIATIATSLIKAPSAERYTRILACAASICFSASVVTANDASIGAVLGILFTGVFVDSPQTTQPQGSERGWMPLPTLAFMLPLALVSMASSPSVARNPRPEHVSLVGRTFSAPGVSGQRYVAMLAAHGCHWCDTASKEITRLKLRASVLYPCEPAGETACWAQEYLPVAGTPTFAAVDSGKVVAQEVGWSQQAIDFINDHTNRLE